jgi:hypothetical protein
VPCVAMAWPLGDCAAWRWHAPLPGGEGQGEGEDGSSPLRGGGMGVGVDLEALRRSASVKPPALPALPEVPDTATVAVGAPGLGRQSIGTAYAGVAAFVAGQGDK